MPVENNGKSMIPLARKISGAILRHVESFLEACSQNRRFGWIADPLFLLVRNRRLLYQTTITEISRRYAGSALGLVWVGLYPLLFLGVYALIFLTVFKVRFDLYSSNEYVAIIFCGLIPFLTFAEGLATGVSSVVSNSNLVKNTLFPIELIPVRAVFSAQTIQMVGLVMLIITSFLLGRLTWWVLLVPVIWLFQIFFMIGLIWILSGFNVFFRDLQNIVSVVILMLMMITPIAYPVDMIPANLRPLLGLNPLYYLVAAYQDVLMNGRFPHGEIFWILLGMSFAFLVFGHLIFKRLMGVFADYV